MLEAARKTSKTCQIEGCHEITVGSRTALCRKHRNNRYKQNYKKKKRRAQGSDVSIKNIAKGFQESSIMKHTLLVGHFISIEKRISMR